jgi:hypothetical protein
MRAEPDDILIRKSISEIGRREAAGFAENLHFICLSCRSQDG